jgi:hypothetical protein
LHVHIFIFVFYFRQDEEIRQLSWIGMCGPRHGAPGRTLFIIIPRRCSWAMVHFGHEDDGGDGKTMTTPRSYCKGINKVRTIRSFVMHFLHLG